MMDRTETQAGYEITTDGVTIWINGAEGCVARFGPGGVEIQEHTWRTLPFSTFREFVRRRLQVSIDESWRPERCK